MWTLPKKLRITAVNKLRIILPLLVLLLQHAVRAQDSCSLQVSLLTCSPGSELYSIFGHSALRIRDEQTGTDIVYNYGTFDFGDPEFYSKFVNGKLLYFLSQNHYPDFINAYAADGRTVAEQFLALSCQQKTALQQFVWNNMAEENRYYRYDFLYDNCTTRLRDMIQRFRDSSYINGQIPQADGRTFREALHHYLDKGRMPWSKLGIDLLLGATIDQKMTNREAMFLPEFLETSLDSTKNAASLVASKQFPVRITMDQTDTGSLTSHPATLFSLLALFMTLLSFNRQQRMQRFLLWLDRLFFFVLGLIGLLLTYMWWGTDHRQTVNNYNLLWAWPFHIIVLFVPGIHSVKWRLYWTVTGAGSLLLLLCWFFIPQTLNPVLLPIILLVAFRSSMNVLKKGIHDRFTA